MIRHGPIDGHGTKVTERCPHSGERQASRRGDEIVISHSRCSVLNGPPYPPIIYDAATVEFVLEDFTAEESREQRDKAEAELNEMRPEFHRRGRQIDAVQEALWHR